MQKVWITTIGILTLGGIAAQAESFIVPTHLISLPRSAVVRPVFSPSEQKALREMGAGDWAVSSVVDIASLSESLDFERALKKARVPFERNRAPLLQGTDTDLRELQWGIENRGGPVSYAVSGFQQLTVPGSGGDSGAVRVGEAQGGRDVKVAVLDSGVDVGHPRLKGQIFQNTQDCQALAAYQSCRADLKSMTDTTSPAYAAKAKECQTLAQVDGDGNGYALDCNGWNAADPSVNPVTKVRGSYDVTDKFGHGTHVAGVVAADGRDGGPRGVTLAAKIIPVKVIDEDPNAPARPQSLGAVPDPSEATLGATTRLSDVVARGLLYAIRSGVDVINMSLAWGSLGETPLMKKLVELAISRGIVVVAAAGNDGTESRVYPCAYDGVICVGAHGPDDGLAHFSNWGPAVDLAAPGFSIVSTIPAAVRSRQLLRTGYEVKFGTSFAAPYVAGAVARLLSQGMSVQETLARLRLGTRSERASSIENPKVEAKFTESGLLDLEKALKVAPQALIRPLVKQIPRLRFDGQAGSEIAFDLKFENAWKQATQVSLEATVASPGVELVGGPKVVATHGAWGSGEVRVLPLRLKVNDPAVDDIVELQVVTTADGVLRKTRVLLDLGVAFGATGPLPAGVRRIPIAPGAIPPGAKLVSVNSAAVGELQDYFAFKAQPPAGPNSKVAFTVTLLSQGLHASEANAPYQARGHVEIQASGAPEIFRLDRIDLNRDGRDDYLLVLRNTFNATPENPKPKVQYDFYAFDDSLSPLPWAFDGSNVVTVVTEFVDVAATFRMALVSGRLMPAWVNVGYIPKASQKPSTHWTAMHGNGQSKGIRLYTVAPEGLIEVRPPEVASWIEPESNVVAILDPTSEQRARGALPVLVARDPTKSDKLMGRPESYWQAELLEGQLRRVREWPTTPYYPFQLIRNIQAVQTGEGVAAGVTAFINDGATSEMEAMGVSASGPSQSMVRALRIRASAPVESVVNVVGVGRTRRFGADVWDAVAQTQFGLLFIDGRTGESAEITSRRTSFLPSAGSARSIYPAVFRQNGQSVFGAYAFRERVAGSAMDVFLPEWDGQGRLLRVVRPAKLHIAPAQNCEDMANLIQSDDRSQAPEIALYCGDAFVRVKLEL